MKPLNRARQEGQAFLWVFATLAGCCALLMIVFNVGQVATEKERTTNAADAVAMSGDEVQARLMNLLAYNNRAIIANEMTIAQAAAIDSWFQYNNQITQNVSYVTSWIPVIGEITQDIADVMATIAPYVTDATTLATEGFQGAVDVLEGQRQLLSQPAFIAGAVLDMAQQVAAKNNVAMNDNSAFTAAAFAANYDANDGFYVVHSGDDRQDADDVMMASRDDFTTWRGAGKLIDYANLQASFSLLTPQLVKTSGTTKLADFDHWESQDSLDLFISVCIPFVGCEGIPIVPVGWGRANVDQDGSDDGNNWATERKCVGASWTPACWAAEQFGPDGISGWDGVPDMIDVKDRTQEIHYFVSVKSIQAPQTSQQLGIDTASLPGPQGSPQVTDNLALGELQAISSARVFFKRPQRESADHTGQSLWRADSVQEYASLYNPYWQARLHTPNCQITSPTSEDCIWRGLLAAGTGSVGVEAVIDAVNP